MRIGRGAAITALVVLGAAAGLGIYTFAYAKGWSYMTNDPKACANCHVMNEQYDGWLKAGHRSVATCNDWHTPHLPQSAALIPVSPTSVSLNQRFW